LLLSYRSNAEFAARIWPINDDVAPGWLQLCIIENDVQVLYGAGTDSLLMSGVSMMPGSRVGSVSAGGGAAVCQQPVKSSKAIGMSSVKIRMGLP
jgi:hypothetical protein